VYTISGGKTMITFITLLYFLEFGYSPMSSTQLTNQEVFIEDSFYINLFSEVRFWDLFFIGGEALTHMTKSTETKYFSPYNTEYIFRSGFDFGNVIISYEHLCTHPVIYKQGELPPNLFRAYDRFTIRVGNW